jgi:hypothetical protein
LFDRNQLEYNQKSQKCMAENRAREKGITYRVVPTAERTPSPEAAYRSIRTYQSQAAAKDDPEVIRRKGSPDIEIITEQFRLMDTPSRPRSALENIRHDNSTPIQDGSRPHFIAELFWDPNDDDIFPRPLEPSSALQMLSSITESDDEWTDDGEGPFFDRDLFLNKDCNAVPTRNDDDNPFLIVGDHNVLDGEVPFPDRDLFLNKDCNAVPTRNDDDNPFFIVGDHNVLDDDRNSLPGWTTLDEGGAASADEESEEDEVDELNEDDVDEIE